jgi:Flp pilus assembly protein TadG
MTTGRQFLALAAALAAAMAGCGATPPQAPKKQADVLNTATGGISTACGLASQVTAFSGGHEPDLTTLQDTALVNVRLLASVYRRNPRWVFQNDTVRELVSDSVTMLRSCGLGRPAQALLKLTAKH